MSGPTLLRYAYTCSNGDFINTEWRDADLGAPTKCYDDSSHTVNTNSIRVIERKDPNDVNIVETATPTNGYAHDTIAFNIPANTTNHPYEVQWDEDRYIMSISYTTTVDHEGDEFQVLIGEDTTVGIISEDISSGSTTVSVSSASMPYFLKGYKLKLTDGTNTNDVGYIRSIDIDNNTVTFETATTNSFLASSPTQLQMTRIMAGRDGPVEFGPPQKYLGGNDKIGSSHLPAGTKVKILYTNKSPTESKRFIINMYYMY